MQKLTLHSNKEKHVVYVPTAYKELNLKQLISIETNLDEKPDVLRVFSTLTGLNIQVTQNLKNKDLERQIFNCVQFLNKPPKWDELQHPRRLEIGKKYYKVPNKVNDFMIGQTIIIKQTVQEPETLLINMPFIIATIMQPYVDKVANKGELVYNETRIKAIQEQVLNCNALEAFATGRFFFAKYKKCLSNGAKNLTKYQRPKGQTRKLLKSFLLPTD